MLGLLAQAASDFSGLETIGKGLIIGLAAIGPGIGLGILIGSPSTPGRCGRRCSSASG